MKAGRGFWRPASVARSAGLASGRPLSGFCGAPSGTPLLTHRFARQRAFFFAPRQRMFHTTAASANKSFRYFACAGVACAFVGAYRWNVYAQDDSTSPDTNVEEEKGLLERLKELIAQLSNAEAKDKLLPDPYPPPYGKKYTVVISDDILVTRDYQPTAGGMLTKKRPGVEYFLATLAQNYEIVVFTLQPMQPYAFTLEKLDPNHHITHRLFVDSTTLQGQKQIKDLTKLNRDLSKVIAIDIAPDRAIPQENLIVLPKYDGSLTDSTLLELLSFFKLLSADHKNDDVRLYVKAFNTNGLEFFKKKWEDLRRQWEQKKQEEREERAASTAEEDEALVKPSRRLWGF